MAELTNEAQIDLNWIAKILGDAYIDVDRSDPGYLRVVENSVVVAIFHDDEKQQVTFLSLWDLKMGTENEKLAFANRLNREIVLVRFSITRDGSLYCDQQLQVKGGISARWLILTLKRFAEVCRGVASANRDTVG